MILREHSQFVVVSGRKQRLGGSIAINVPSVVYNVSLHSYEDV